MTPQPQPHRRRVPVRRSAALLAAMIVIGGTPLVARAIGDDIRPPIAQATDIDTERPPVRQTEPLIREGTVRPARTVRETAPEPALVDPVVGVLTDTYTWDERGPRIALLQQALGIAVDGVYGSATQQAHLGAFDFLGLPTDTVPASVLLSGPDPTKWAVLCQCESNGNYVITNPSGRYRGAYQFDRSTWNSVAGRHVPRLVGIDPATASPADQDAMAFALYIERGARPWPHCGRHLA